MSGRPSTTGSAHAGADGQRVRPMTMPDALPVIVVGRSPEKMEVAMAVLRSHGFVATGVFSEDEARRAIAEQEEVFAVVAGGSIDEAAQRRLRAAATQRGAKRRRRGARSGMRHGEERWRGSVRPASTSASGATAASTASARSPIASLASGPAAPAGE